MTFGLSYSSLYIGQNEIYTAPRVTVTDKMEK